MQILCKNICGKAKYIGLYRENGGHLGIQDGRHRVALKKWNQPQFESLGYKDSKKTLAPRI